ncbi:MAG TPA: GGDEF domain-containing protein [Longimicrobiales bacterium]|nr:GGDEF domain-containing protein [Longimicrobiales bacterium]
MRSDSDTPPPRIAADLSRPETRSAAAAGLLLVGTLLTGATTSPLLPALAAALAFWVRYEPRPLVLAAPPVAGVMLLAAASLHGGVTATAILAAMIAVLAVVPGLYWRRDVRRGVARSAGTGDSMDARRIDPYVLTAAEEDADLDRALAAVAGRIGASAVILWDVDGYHRVAHRRAGYPRHPPLRVRMSGDPLGWTWENAMRFRVERSPDWAEPGTLVVLDPLRRMGEGGCILTYAFEPGRMPADELPFDETAVYVRGILNFREARKAAEEDRQRMRTLLAGLTRTPGELDIESYAPEVCEIARDLVGGTGATVGSWHGDHGAVLATAGDDGGPRTGDIFVPPDSELALAIRAGTMIVRTAAEWTLSRTHIAQEHERWRSRPRSLAVLPLRAGENVIGVLAVWSSESGALNPEWLDVLHMLAPYAAIHLQHARQYGSIKQTAERDPLTQLRNRRAFEELFATETARFDRYGRPLSLLMIDLDHFKGVNDTHGHEAGDEVLRRTARIIGECIRDVDTAARLGGEEFVVLMPETGLSAAVDAAERIRSAISAAVINWQGTIIPVHASIGVSTAPHTAPAPSDLIRSADEALYTAKDQGRDRVVAAATR